MASILCGGDIPVWSSLKDWNCWVCFQPCTGMAVYWQGGNTVLLHVACAHRLALELVGDAREAQLVNSEVRAAHHARNVERAKRIRAV